MQNYYDYFKSIHIVSVIFWMAGMLYLPRLYVYHSQIHHNSESYDMLCTMEKRLIFIMTLSMLLVLIMGGILFFIYNVTIYDTWFHIKMLSVLSLLTIHGLFIRYHKRFVGRNNKKSAMFYRVINELVALLIIISVFMVVLKPYW
ncbi:hypothetical protein OCHUTO_0608 [Orientia chuto str. Dubai]|uniref:Protoporphyrinogen IX oxidase n=1 Tax=Orientia chuto str. Dubai TaxID=1359168 RepID=A0A0F3MKE1_9RICK|nr:CopD family protein [Candidatus Orientia mediorientalis]KJV56106.1 hypothetical protein OCHUTO_0608 [Orientia chuto str. Dubai]